MDSGRLNIYMLLDGVPEEAVFKPLNEFVAEAGGNKRGRATAPRHVTFRCQLMSWMCCLKKVTSLSLDKQC